MTARTPVLDRLADRLVGFAWQLDRRLPARCAACRAWVPRRLLPIHDHIEHAGDPEWGD